MDILQLLILLVVAGICGAIAELVVGFSPGGFVVSIIVGVIGAYLGTFLAAKLGAPTFLLVTVVGRQIDLLWAVIGSILLLALIMLLRGRGGERVRRFSRRR